MKRKLGTHKRAKKKQEEMSSVLCKMRYGGVGEKKKIERRMWKGWYVNKRDFFL